jgi:tetratricopeptide (TPR) repeat protein
MALRKEPARRYQSVEQLVGDIRRYLESRPVLARPDTIAYRTGKFIQRNRAASAAALLILFSLVAGLIATTWEAHRAEVERGRAERRFNDVRQLAHSVLFDYHDAIKDLPGATRARERLVKDALTYLDGLAKEAGGDPELQRELAAAYERVGDVRGQTYTANVGDRAGALDSYEKSLRIRETLRATDPTNAQSRRELAASYRKIGNILLETSDAPRGLQLLRKALAIDLDLAQENRTDPNIRRDLAQIHNDVGQALEYRGEMPAALEQQRQALALREELALRDLSDSKAQRDLCVSRINTGRIFFLSGDIPAALTINSKALDVAQRLLARDPTNADYRRLVAIAHQNNGDYRAQSGDIEGARESFQKKIALDEQAVAADSANVQARRDFAYSSERLGILSAQLGDRAEAMRYFQRNLSTREKIVADDPQNLDARYALTIAEAEVALSTAQEGQRDHALELCRQTIGELEGLSLDPTNVYLCGLRARAYDYLGDTYSALAANEEDWQNARRNYERSLALWNDLRDRKLLLADDTTRPEETARAIAKVDRALARK